MITSRLWDDWQAYPTSDDHIGCRSFCVTCSLDLHARTVSTVSVVGFCKLLYSPHGTRHYRNHTAVTLHSVMLAVKNAGVCREDETQRKAIISKHAFISTLGDRMSKSRPCFRCVSACAPHSGEAPRDTKTSTWPSNAALRPFLDVAKTRSASIRYFAWTRACLVARSESARALRMMSRFVLPIRLRLP